jgi:hypothetical protein
VLQGEAENDCSVASVRVGLISAFMVIQKQLDDLAIGQTADCCGEAQTFHLEREIFALRSIWWRYLREVAELAR